MVAAIEQNKTKIEIFFLGLGEDKEIWSTSPNRA